MKKNGQDRIEIVTSAKEDVAIATNLFNNATEPQDVERAIIILAAAEERLNSEFKLLKQELKTSIAEKTFKCKYRECLMVLKVTNLAEGITKLGGSAWYQSEPKLKSNSVTNVIRTGNFAQTDKLPQTIKLHTICPQCKSIDSFEEQQDVDRN